MATYLTVALSALFVADHLITIVCLRDCWGAYREAEERNPLLRRFLFKAGPIVGNLSVLSFKLTLLWTYSLTFGFLPLWLLVVLVAANLLTVYLNARGLK